MEMQIKHSHQSGPVRARFAMHQRRIGDGFEDLLGPVNARLARRLARAHGRVHQRDSVRRTRFALKREIAAVGFAAEINDRLKAHRAITRDLLGRGLVGPRHRGVDPVEILVDRPQKAVIGPHQVRLGPDAASRRSEVKTRCGHEHRYLPKLARQRGSL
jgi:hypothetical protein